MFVELLIGFSYIGESNKRRLAWVQRGGVDNVFCFFFFHRFSVERGARKCHETYIICAFVSHTISSIHRACSSLFFLELVNGRKGRLTSPRTLQNPKWSNKLHKTVDPRGFSGKLDDAIVSADVQHFSPELMRQVCDGFEVLVLESQCLAWREIAWMKI